MYTGFFGPLNKYLSQANQTKPTIQPYDFLCFDASVPFSKGIASFASSAVAKTTAAVPFPWAESTKCQQNSLFCCLFVDLDVFPKYIYIYIICIHIWIYMIHTYIFWLQDISQQKLRSLMKLLGIKCKVGVVFWLIYKPGRSKVKQLLESWWVAFTLESLFGMICLQI